MSTLVEINEANAKTIKETANALEQARVAATRRYEIANRLHQNAIAEMARVVIASGGDLLDGAVRMAAAEVVRTAHTTYSARAEEKALGEVSQMAMQTITRNGALRTEWV